jgi:hypothetical protein
MMRRAIQNKPCIEIQVITLNNQFHRAKRKNWEDIKRSATNSRFGI